MKKYLCYDIKGIQQYIFSIPQLKYVIGGSLVIADYDRKWESSFDGIDTIFSGGGKGVFYIEEDRCKDFKQFLVKQAHSRGLDIQLGVADTFIDAMAAAGELYPYLPETADTGCYPCTVSGLWPVAKGSGKGPDNGIHPKVYLRRKILGDDYFTRTFLSQGSEVYKAVSGKLNGRKLEFLTYVSKEDDNGSREVADRGRAGDYSLGLRKRWAVVAMDGNDMGAQFRRAAEQEDDNEKVRDRISCMSRELGENCTLKAFEEALGSVVQDWLATADLDKCTYRAGDEKRLVLPFRPLILGGDDVLLLSHCSHALSFVHSMSEAFTKKSRTAATQIKTKKQFDLWPATNGELTISAGIVYMGVTYPLHTAIPYAETLLANAKKYAKNQRADDPSDESVKHTGAAVDWEHITEALIDDPSTRRSRELIYHDEDLDVGIQLTRKPYLIGDIHGLVEKRVSTCRKIPNHIRASLKSILLKPWAQRSCALAALERGEKEIRKLVFDLRQYDYPKDVGPAWVKENTGTGDVLSTDILDVISLIDEEHRMAQRDRKGVQG